MFLLLKKFHKLQELYESIFLTTPHSPLKFQSAGLGGSWCASVVCWRSWPIAQLCRLLAVDSAILDHVSLLLSSLRQKARTSGSGAYSAVDSVHIFCGNHRIGGDDRPPGFQLRPNHSIGHWCRVASVLHMRTRGLTALVVLPGHRTVFSDGERWEDFSNIRCFVI